MGSGAIFKRIVQEDGWMDGYYLKFVHFVVLYSLFKLKFSLI